jgi:TonB family protein
LYILFAIAALTANAATVSTPKTEQVATEAQKVAEESELSSADSYAPVSYTLPPPTDGSILPNPKANPGLWVRSEDYPVRALREGRTGRTSFRLDVDKSGRVTKCTVIVSSGHDDLDAAACDFVTTRALFDPAKDKRGKVVAGNYQNSVLWRIPNAIDLPKIGQSTITFVVEIDGTMSDCKFETTVDVPASFDPCAAKPVFEPRRNEAGEPIRARVVTSNVVRIFKLTSEPSQTKPLETKPK